MSSERLFDLYMYFLRIIIYNINSLSLIIYIRFISVEKVSVLARLMNTDHIKDNHVIVTSLAHVFCHLIATLNDINSSVVVRTVLYLESIKEATIKVSSTYF